MASSTGSSRFSDTTTKTFASGSAPCSFQAMPAAWRAISSERGLRIDAVGLDVALEADVADGVGVGIGVLQVRPLGRFRIGEDDFRADFEAGADGFGERIGRLDGHVDRPDLVGSSSG